MKYIVIQLGEHERLFVFPREIDHDRMFEACEAIRFGDERNWVREIRKNGEVIAAGFITHMCCHGSSETLCVASRGEVDTQLFLSQFKAGA